MLRASWSCSPSALDARKVEWLVAPGCRGPSSLQSDCGAVFAWSRGGHADRAAQALRVHRSARHHAMVVSAKVADLFAAEACVASECYRFSSAVGAELGQNVADPVADALFCEYEAAGDDSVVQPSGDEVQDLSIAWC